MPKEIDQNVSDAFSYLLKRLCINQFPCGDGPWRSGNKWRCDSPDLLNPSKEQDPNLESVQSLKEVSELEPFINKPDWSEDGVKIRQLGIVDPSQITDKKVLQHFTKLRLASMNIVEVDDGLLRFKNLKELTLSANKIEKIDPRSLPNQLELLELYGNRINDIRVYPRFLPSLVHFGIGCNCVMSITGAITQSQWVSLLSLDLSSNEISDLKETLETLKNLPKLSNLLLQGNPLFFSAGYRGLVVDTLKQLSILDDLRITAEEKHRYKGTSRLKGLPSSEAIMDIKMNSLKNVRVPQENENENCEEFPRTERRYQVVYFFPSNSTVKKRKRKRKMSEQTKALEKEQTESCIDAEDRKSCSDTDDDAIDPERQNNLQDGPLRQKKTREKNWSEDAIEFNYEKTLMTADLICLKKFIQEGVKVKLIEHKVLVSPDPPSLPDDNASCVGDGDIDKGSKAGRRKSFLKEKQKQAPPKTATKDGKPRGKKKGKGEEIDLFELSRESREIAEACLSLEDLISGSKNLETQLLLSPIENVEKETPQEASKEKASNTKQISNADLKRKGKDSRKFSPRTSATLQRNKSALSTKGGKNDRSKTKESKVLIEISEAVKLQPLPDVTIDVAICLHSWKTAKEAQDWINEMSVSD